MAKNIVQDVIPPQNVRRTIRNITLTRSSENSEKVLERDSEISNVPKEPVREIRYSRKEEETVDWSAEEPKNRGKWIIWIIGVIAVCGLIFILGNFFSGATVSITPKSQKVSINIDLVAKPGALAGDLGYTSITIAQDGDEVVSADGDRPVESRASGTIIIYNNYSTTPQRLVKNTRFETPDGLIYKIANSVTVPGRHTVSGKIIPGSIETLVYAEATGSEYNIGLTDFTIPGFKSNADRFAKFYGRSKTPMSGGKIGTEKFVSDEKMLQARARIEGKLLKDLIAEAKTKVPNDSVFYDKAYRITFEPVITANSGNNVTVRERARFTAFFIGRDSLAMAIAQNAVDNYDNVAVTSSDEENLAFEMKNGVATNNATIGPIQFNVKGDASILWTFDQNKLKNGLAGKNKAELSSVISGYPAIIKADVVIRPFWKNAFPPANKIKLNILK